MYEAQRFDHGDNIQDNSKINKWFVLFESF